MPGYDYRSLRDKIRRAPGLVCFAISWRDPVAVYVLSRSGVWFVLDVAGVAGVAARHPARFAALRLVRAGTEWERPAKIADICQGLKVERN
jgi:hypothetical protein